MSAPNDLAREERIARALARLDATIERFGTSAFRWLDVKDLLDEALTDDATGSVRPPALPRR